MNDSRISRIVTACVVSACALVGASVALGQTRPADITPPPPAPSASQPAPDQPIGVINGHPLDNRKFNQLLMSVSGLRVFQEVMDWTLVQQACVTSGVPVDGKEFQELVQAELNRTLDNLRLENERQNPGQKLSDDDLRRGLGALLQRQGVTDVEFQIGLQRAAGLRALSRGKITVTEDDISKAFEAQTGDRAEIRVLQLRDQLQAGDVRKAIEGGKKPEEVGAQMGIGVQGWTISANADQIPEIRTTIFGNATVAPALKKAGDLSAAMQVNGQWIMIYLEKKIPKDPAAKLDAATKAKMEKLVQDFKETQWMNGQLNIMRQNAHVQINDPILSAQWMNFVRQIEARNAAGQPPATGAATMPGIPATAPAPK